MRLLTLVSAQLAAPAAAPVRAAAAAGLWQVQLVAGAGRYRPWERPWQLQAQREQRLVQSQARLHQHAQSAGPTNPDELQHFPPGSLALGSTAVSSTASAALHNVSIASPAALWLAARASCLAVGVATPSPAGLRPASMLRVSLGCGQGSPAGPTAALSPHPLCSCQSAAVPL